MTEDQSQDAFGEYADDLLSHPNPLTWLGFGLARAKYSGKRLNGAIRNVVGNFDPSKEGLKWRRNMFSSPMERCKV